MVQPSSRQDRETYFSDWSNVGSVRINVLSTRVTVIVSKNHGLESFSAIFSLN